MKKAIAMLLVIAMTAALAIGGTLAYLTDTDEDVNVMTLGQVKIDQLEYERVDVESADDKAEVQEFRDNKPLLPAVTEDGFNYVPGESYVDWEQIGKDGYTSDIWDPTKINNEVDKMVFVKNKGDWDAYVRTVFAFEAGSYTTLDEFNAKMHLNLNTTDFTWEWVETPMTIGEGTYFVAVATYNKVLTPGALTEISLSQIALDKPATNDDVAGFGDTYQVLVQSQAVQAAGFDDPDTALNEAFGKIGSDATPPTPFPDDNPTKGGDLRTALHYLDGDPTGTKITNRIGKVVYALNSEYPEIVNTEKGTLVDIEQDVDVHAYYVEQNGTYTVYFLSNGTIYAPADSADLYANMDALVEVDTHNFDVSRVETMSNMFLNCKKLAVMDVSDWDTGNVTNMFQTFRNCNALVAQVENWDVSKVTNMYAMFAYNNALTELDLSNWQVSNVQDMGALFNSCVNLTDLDVSTWDTSGATRLFATFQDCRALTTVDVSGWDTSNVTDMCQMFQRCYKLTGLDTSNWDVGNVTTMMFMFRFCYELTDLDVSNWDTGNVELMNAMFSGNYALEELDVSNWDVSNVTTFANLFASENQNGGDMKLKKLDVSKWNPVNVTDMGGMFYGCGALTEIDMSDWNLPKLTTVSHMFADCHNLETIDVSGWQTPALTNLDAMFNDCRKLKEIDMSSFDTSNVTIFGQLFEVCYALEHVYGLENWDTSKGNDFSEMFSGCGSLKELNLSSFDTRNANSNPAGNWVFQRFMTGCDSLETVTFGPNFSFDGNGTCPDIYKFEMPAATGVDGWDGSWYDAQGNAYAPAEIPEETAATYYAVNPATP